MKSNFFAVGFGVGGSVRDGVDRGSVGVLGVGVSVGVAVGVTVVGVTVGVGVTKVTSAA